MMQDAPLLILAGPAAVGKTTAVREILGADSRFSFVRSVTTRPPRGDGFDAEYLYLSEPEFLARRDSGELLEWMEYGHAMYGTPHSELARIRANGQIPLLILDLCGVHSVRLATPPIPAYAIYLYTDLNTAEQRLYDRYLSPIPSVEGLRSFAGRKEANIRDYLTIREHTADFDLFLSEAGTPREVADSILAAYDSRSHRPQENERVAVSLTAQAEEKRQGSRQGGHTL